MICPRIRICRCLVVSYLCTDEYNNISASDDDVTDGAQSVMCGVCGQVPAAVSEIEQILSALRVGERHRQPDQGAGQPTARLQPAVPLQLERAPRSGDAEGQRRPRRHVQRRSISHCTIHTSP